MSLHYINKQFRLQFLFGFLLNCAIFTNLCMGYGMGGKDSLFLFFFYDGCKSDYEDLMTKQNRDLFCSFFFSDFLLFEFFRS